MRFSNNGSYGIGNYFAVNAAYSCSPAYVHTEPNGTHGVFLAFVLVGEYANFPD